MKQAAKDKSQAKKAAGGSEKKAATEAAK